MPSEKKKGKRRLVTYLNDGERKELFCGVGGPSGNQTGGRRNGKSEGNVGVKEGDCNREIN